MYSSTKSDKLDKSEGDGDGLPGGGDKSEEQFTESQILNFVESVETLNVVVERPVAGWKPSDHISDEESFTLPSEGTKGLALLINIVEFDNDITNISRRYGSEHDVEYLTDLLIQLDYKLYPGNPSIRERKNKSKRVIKSQIESFKNLCTQQQPSSILVFIGSHGSHPNRIVTSDRQWLHIYEDVIHQFTLDPNFTVLEGKPKIFLVQACQSYCSTSGGPTSTHASVHQDPQQQHFNDDVYICTATTPGKVSMRNIYKGSWFPYCFTYMMMKHALKMKSLQEIMTSAKNRMDEIKDYQEYKQLPSYISGNNDKPLYFVGSDYSSSRVRNYDENLPWMEGASKFCIICTIEKHITCDKLTENFRDKYSILIHDWKQFPEFILSDLCHLDDKVVDIVMDCKLKHFELVLRKLEKVKRHRIIFITSVEKQVMLKLNPAKFKVDVTVDPMSFEDLSLAYQFKIVERLENKFGINLSEDELHGELLIDIVTGRQLFHDEIKPRHISYYVPRMVLTRNIISNKLFEGRTSSDIFIIRGIQRSQLSFLVKNQMTGRSQDQMERITVNFMTLDDDSHFDIICDNTTKPVHLLNFENGKLRWIRTRGNIKSVQEHVSKKQEEQMEEDFCSLICAHSSAPVCISDSPGMGKTILLAQIGKRLRRMFPDRTVLFLELSSFIQRVANATKYTDEIDSQIIITALQDTVCKSLLGRHILESKLNSNQLSIELLLDGFDEVEHKDSDFAHGILKTIRKSFNSIRMWVTARPHKLKELEETLGGLGYKIKPFQLVDQVNFLTQFWSRNTKLNSQRLADFARHCLKSLKIRINSSQSQQDIAGIPLQCLLIGEVYERRAVEHAKIGASSPLPEQFLISSITSLYQEVVKKKLAKYGSTYGAHGSHSETSHGLILNWLRSLGGTNTNGASQAARQKLSEDKLNKLHAHLGLRLIFPDIFQKLKLSFNPQEICEVLNVGVWELSGGTEPRVLHRTFAEYFVALFIRDVLISGNGWGKVLSRFFIHSVLAVQFNKNGVPEFAYPVVVYFLNSLLTPDIAIISKVAKDIKIQIVNVNPQLSQLVYALAYADCANILKYFDKIGAFYKPDTASSIFDNKFISCAIAHSGVELIRLGFLHFEQHHQEQFDPVMKSKLLRLAVERGQDVPVEFLINEKGLRRMVEDLHDETKTLLHHCLASTTDNADFEIDQRLEILRMLSGINPGLKEERDSDGDPALLVRNANVPLRMELICLGADVTAQGESKQTILHGGLGYNREDYQVIVKKIHEIGRLKELVHFQCEEGKPPLLSIVKRFDPLPETLKMFAEAGADFNYSSGTEWPALIYAVSYNRSVSTLQNLIEFGADKNCRSMNGNTMLHVAADKGTKSAEALEFLVRVHGLDVNVTNNARKTPLDTVLEMKYGYGGKEFFEMGLLIFELGGRPNNSKDSLKGWSKSDIFEGDWNSRPPDHSRGRMAHEVFNNDRPRMGGVYRGGWAANAFDADETAIRELAGCSWWGDKLYEEDREMKPLYVDILLLHVYLFGEEIVESSSSEITAAPSPHLLNYSDLKVLLLKKGAKDRSYGAMGRLTEILRRTVERTTPIWDQDTIYKFRAGELI